MQKKGGSFKRYGLEQSCFFRLERRKDLAHFLGMSLVKLNDLISNRQSSYDVRDEEINGKMRRLQVPLGAMRRCHSRILSLLKRVKLPPHIKSPRRGSLAWKNADIHREAEFISTFDIKNFYPSTSEEHVFRLFKHRFLMSSDCARLMAKICTFEGYLPQGSPASPYVACLAHLDLFDSAARQSVEAGSQLTVWVDDVVISGRSPRRDIQNSIKRRAEAKGLITHKDRRGGGKRGVEITGTYLRGSELTVANSSHLKIKELGELLKVESDPVERYRIFNRLAAITRYQRTVIRSAGGDAQRLNARLSRYKREMDKLDNVLRTVQAKAGPMLDVTYDSDEVF